MSTLGEIKLGKHKLKTPAICGAVIGKNVREMEAGVARAIEFGVDLVELRVDGLRDQTGWEKLLLRAEVPMILTNRPKREGGGFKGSEETRVELLLEGIARGVACIDVELSTPKLLREHVVEQAKKSKVTVLMSHHDFALTPSIETLIGIVKRLAEAGCDIAKIVTFAKEPRDAIIVLDFLTQAQDVVDVPVMAFAMGDAGRVTRIVAPLFGSPITYAAAGGATAPGQLDVEVTKRLLHELTRGRHGSN